MRDTVHGSRSRGFCVWLTGLSGSGKSTTAEALAGLLRQRGRAVTVLDGDAARATFSAGLGFSREDRNENLRRIAAVAARIARSGGAVICATISPYRQIRDECRDMIGADLWLEVFVATSLAVCERRDAKGLYAKARRGELAYFTGISDPYEPPLHPGMTIETVHSTPLSNANAILARLAEMSTSLYPSPGAPRSDGTSTGASARPRAQSSSGTGAQNDHRSGCRLVEQ